MSTQVDVRAVLESDGVHSCGPHCQRIACVLVDVRHEIEAAKRELDTVSVTDDSQSDGIGCAENALDRALAALARCGGAP